MFVAIRKVWITVRSADQTYHWPARCHSPTTQHYDTILHCVYTL